MGMVWKREGRADFAGAFTFFFVWRFKGNFSYICISIMNIWKYSKYHRPDLLDNCNFFIIINHRIMPDTDNASVFAKSGGVRISVLNLWRVKNAI